MTNKITREPWLVGIEGDALPSLILSDSPLIRVVAGPGSGKTLGLKRRVARLIKRDGVSPDAIFVGSFTRAIAGELAEELGVAVSEDEPPGAEGEARVKVSTLHAYARELLQTYPTSRPGREMRFLLLFETSVMLHDLGQVLPALSDQHGRKRKLKEVCAAWAAGDDLEKAGFVGAMERWLRRHKTMLIDEVVNLARRGLESGDITGTKFDHVVVDEYQDLTAAEQVFVESIWTGSGSLVVLGDDDQSIYSFRDNHPTGLSEFADRWSGHGLRDVPLQENRRSGTSIVSLANAMMAHAGSKKAPMLARREDCGDLALVHWPSADAEVAGLAEYMTVAHAKKFLVLVPRRFIGHRLAEAIGPDAMTSFHEQLLEDPVVQERFAFASFAADSNDAAALRVLLGFRRDGITYAQKCNAPAYSTLLQSDLRGLELLDAIVSKRLLPSGQGGANIRHRAAALIRLLEEIPADARDAIGIIFDPDRSDVITDEEKAQKARRDLVQLRRSALAISESTPDLRKIIERLRHHIAVRLPLDDRSDARVRIMTMHSAKGLEADVVVVAGAADQIMPGRLPRGSREAEDHVEEQRRLLYVSITRARRELVISWPCSVMYATAMSTSMRVDGGTWTTDGVKYVGLGRSSLLPDTATRPEPGRQWLRRAAP